MKNANKYMRQYFMPPVKCMKWAEKEYEEQSVDWSKVAVDTPIYVRRSEDEQWKKRHFAKYEYGKVHTWCDGTTSWSSDADITCVWEFAKLAE